MDLKVKLDKATVELTDLQAMIVPQTPPVSEDLIVQAIGGVE